MMNATKGEVVKNVVFYFDNFFLKKKERAKEIRYLHVKVAHMLTSIFLNLKFTLPCHLI